MTEAPKINAYCPYMIRAFYEWLEDNALTPYLLVDATQDNLVILLICPKWTNCTKHCQPSYWQYDHRQ